MVKRVVILLLLCLMAACSVPFGITQWLEQLRANLIGEAESYNFLSLIEKGNLEILRVTSTAFTPAFAGNLLQLELQNNSRKAIDVPLPCGLTFIPVDETFAQVVVVQPQQIQIEPGAQTVVNPFMISIEPGKWIPNDGQEYRVGEMVDGKLLQFAQCTCNQQYSAQDEFETLLSLQLATWMAAEDESVAQFYEKLNDFTSQLTGLPVAIPGLENVFQGVLKVIAPEASQLLEECGVEIGK
jgi:hypothetical protein